MKQALKRGISMAIIGVVAGGLISFSGGSFDAELPSILGVVGFGFGMLGYGISFW